jgi:catechol 2,3-dioxygenase-like lactoylglutathione lyase family enzyme
MTLRTKAAVNRSPILHAPKVILGNHTAVFAARSEQERIRKFYCDVLGCKARVKTDEVDRFQLEDVHFCFVWQNTAPDESAFLKATWLELQTDKPDEVKQTARLRREKARCARSAFLFSSSWRAGI